MAEVDETNDSIKSAGNRRKVGQCLYVERSDEGEYRSLLDKFIGARIDEPPRESPITF